MDVFKRLFDFYINSSIHVGLAVTALTGITIVRYDLPSENPLLLLVFFGTITGYNFIKYAGIAKLHHRSLAKNLRVIQVFSLSSFVILVYLSFQVSPEVLYLGAILGLLTLFYALPVFNKRNLRTVAGIKVYVIAVIWAGVSVLFPVVQTEWILNQDLVLEFFQRIIFVLVLILPFEIRDLKYDPADLKTIPQVLGKRRTRQLGVGLLAAMLLAEIGKSSLAWDSMVPLVLTLLVTGSFVLGAREDRSIYYTTFWVEGIPIIWLALLLLFRGVF